MNLGDTIAAVSTPRGKGGVALLRISGDEALTVAERVFRPACGRKIGEIAPRTAVYGGIFAREPDGAQTQIDDGIAVFYKAPASFTGEDVVEICCHGGALVTQNVLEAILCAGARQATAGEFTRRAFVGGKLDLSEAEALSSLLEARTYEQLKLSRSGLGGALGGKVGEIYNELRRIVSNVYAVVDFPDEDLSGMDRDEIRDAVRVVHDELIALAATYRTGRAIAEGIGTVICGRTNSGKSSLYNRILGSDAAIVTDIEGTTRDLLEDTVSFGGVTLRLCDTAGLRESKDTVEKIGIDRARERIASAELVLALFDGSRPSDKEDRELADYLISTGATVIPVLTKSDLARVSDIPDSLAQLGPVCISTRTGQGIDELAGRIRSLYIDGNIDISSDAVAVTARQFASLSRAAEAVAGALSALDAGLPEDICSSELEVAMAGLGEVGGREVSEDIVGEIFSKFCVGK